MRKASLALTCILVGCTSARTADLPPALRHNQAAAQFYFAGIDTVAARVRDLSAAIKQLDGSDSTDRRAQQAFANARSAWKSIEGLAEYYSVTAVGTINNPSLEAEEADDPRTSIPPDGFQGLEEFLYPRPQPARKDSLLKIADLLLGQFPALEEYGTKLRLSDATLVEAIRQELVRIQVMTLAGFDSPIAHRGLEEARDALDGVRLLLPIVARTHGDSARRAFDAELVVARNALTGDWETFDRLEFFKTRVPPLSRAFAEFRTASGVPNPDTPNIWRADVGSVFEKDAFDPYATIAKWAGRPPAERVELGRRLFFDPALSRTGDRSCSFCHQPQRAFTDGQKRSVPVPGAQAELRNAPTLINAALQTANFYDLRVETLEEQAGAVVRNPDELHGNLDQVASAIAAKTEYSELLTKAFPEQKQFGGNELRRALAAYVRSLTSLNSRFDRYVRGEAVSISDEERLGFNVFMGKGLCGTCHFAPLFNGTVPPAYVRTESEVIGVPTKAVTHGATIDPDAGRILITRKPTHTFAFKTPTLRNVELTGPYMHNGVYRTLEEVVDFYNRGGGAGIGSIVPNQTLPFDSLSLSAKEQRAIVAFLRTLTDTIGLTSLPPEPILAGRPRR